MSAKGLAGQNELACCLLRESRRAQAQTHQALRQFDREECRAQRHPYTRAGARPPSPATLLPVESIDRYQLMRQDDTDRYRAYIWHRMAACS
jgi:hypothetical protein